MFGIPSIYLTLAKYASIVVLCFGAGAWVTYKIDDGRVQNAKNELITSQANLQIIEANEQTLQNSLNACNKSVDNFKIASDDAAKATQAALDALSKERDLAAKNAATIMAMKPGANICQSALDLVRSQVK